MLYFPIQITELHLYHSYYFLNVPFIVTFHVEIVQELSKIANTPSSCPLLNCAIKYVAVPELVCLPSLTGSYNGGKCTCNGKCMAITEVAMTDLYHRWEQLTQHEVLDLSQTLVFRLSFISVTSISLASLFSLNSN